MDTYSQLLTQPIKSVPLASATLYGFRLGRMAHSNKGDMETFHILLVGLFWAHECCIVLQFLFSPVLDEVIKSITVHY